MPLLKRKRVMAAKVETTIGTAESLTASEGAFNAYNVMIQPTIEVEEREGQGGFGYLPGSPGARQGVATFRTDLGWDGTSTMPTWASVLLPACGFVETSQVYTPRSEAPGSNVKTLTIGCYIDGVLKRIAGAVGTFQLVLPTGRMGYIDWTFTGVWQAPTDASIIAPTYPTASPIRFASATATYDGVAQRVEQVTIDAGNEVVMREDPTTAAGYISALITNRKPIISAAPESQLVATDDTYGDWIAAAQAEWEIELDGPNGSTITISAPKAQIQNAQEGDRNRMVTNDIEWFCGKNGATHDEELSITFAESV